MRSTTPRIVLLVAFAVLVAATADGRVRSDSCADDVAAVVEAACPCAGKVLDTGDLGPWSSHLGYERCMWRAVLAQRRAGCTSTRTAMRILHCAGRSTCGRNGAVLCARDDRPRPRVSRDAATCVAGGGEVLGEGSVCGTPPSTTTTTTTTTTFVPSTAVVPTTTSTTIASELFGNAVEFAEASQHSPGYLLGGPVTVTRGGTLIDVGVIGKASGAVVVLGVYADEMGAPGRLLVHAPPMAVERGPREVAVPQTELPPGTYWLMAVYDAEASVGVDSSVGDAIVAYTEWSASDPLPDPFPPAAWGIGQRFNYFLRVQH